MSNQSFKVKNSLHLTPQAVEPSGLEVGDLWMDIDGNLKRFDGSASQDVGSGGVGSVDIMFAQTLEQAVIGDFTTTGTVAITETPSEVLQGDKSLKITHTGGASVEQIVEVPAKFRNKNVTLSLDVASDALSGNLTLTVTDETNTVTLINAESIQPQEAGQTSVKRSVSFNVPSDCESLKYKFTAVSESGKISFIDNVVIELTETARLSTTIEVPILEEYIDYGAIDIRATTTNPTKGTIVHDKFHARRSGSQLDVRVDFHQSTAGTAGSGTYYIQLPNSLQVDVAKIPSSGVLNGVVGSGVESESGGVERQIVFRVEAANPSRIYLEVVTTSTSNLQYSYTPVSSSFLGLNTALVSFSGTMTLPILGWEATETQSVSLAQTVLVQESDSYINVSGTTGYGSTRTTIRRFTNARSLGEAITYIDDPVNGASFVVNEAGLYDLSFTEQSNSGTPVHSITVNQTNFPTPTTSEIVASATISTATGTTTASVGGYYLNAGDVVRCHSTLAITSNTGTEFNISKAGALKQLNVSENQKIEIPTSELRMEGASSRGTGSDAGIVRFDNVAKLRGDAFEIESTAALGTVITMKKAGRISISANITYSAAGQITQITKNQQTRTGNSTTASEILATQGAGTSSSHNSASYSGDVNVGDILRVNHNGTVNANVNNNLNITFQEQEVSVSVTNVLPQFSESDSSVRVDTANGYGSTATKIRRFSTVRTNIGTAVTYADSAVDGASFTINESGLYHLSYTDELNAAQEIGISLNADATDITTNYGSLAKAKRLTVASANTNFATCSAASVYLQAGDVVRAHSNGSPNGDQENAYFIISKVGKPNVTGVDVTPFAKIEYEVKDVIQAPSTSTFGSTNTGVPVFSPTINTNKGVLQFQSDSVLGSRFVALKKCTVSISANAVFNSGSGAFYFTKNSTLFTTGSMNGEIGRIQHISPNGQIMSYNGNVQLEVGDVLRFQRDATVTSINGLTVVATELRDAYQVIGGGVENTYSARITSAGAIESQSYPFIESVTKGGTGLYNINLKPGFFTVAPSCTVSIVSSTAVQDDTARVNQLPTTSLIVVRTGASSTGTSWVNADFPFNITVTRQGSDYRTPSKAIGLPAQRVAYVQRTVGPATSAGSSVAGSWNAIPLATVQDPSGIGVSLASNIITLPAGTYDIKAMSAHRSADTQIRLRNITDSSTALVGLSAYGSNASDAAIMTSTAEGIITLNSTKTFELQYRVAIGFTFGLGGMGSNFAENVLTASVKIVKLEE